MGFTEELRRLGAAIGHVLREDPDGEGFALETRSHSLLAAMWVQFAHALAQNHTVRPCAVCGAWIEVGQGQVGSHMSDISVSRPRAPRGGLAAPPNPRWV